MVHRAWSSIVEVPYCFSRSYVKFQGHTALKIIEFDPNWAFPDSNSSLNSPMAMKCCTKLETAKERCPIVFQGHPSNFKVTRDKTSPILTQIGRFRIIGRSQLSNPSDLPCFGFGWCVYPYPSVLLSLEVTLKDAQLQKCSMFPHATSKEWGLVPKQSCIEVYRTVFINHCAQREASLKHFEIPMYQIRYWNPYHPTLRRRPMCRLLTVPLLSYPQEEAHE